MAAERRVTRSTAGDLSDDEDAAEPAFRALDFEPGAQVEVRRNYEGFRGTWYEAAVLRRLPARQRYDVAYVSHVPDKGPSGRIRERVNCNYVRPRPPPFTDRRYRCHDRVEAFFKDGWWFGVVSGVLLLPTVGRYTVCLPARREEMEFGHSDLRPQLHWNSDRRLWIPVEEMETGQPIFDVGDHVEASLDVKGYGAAWFSAIVLKVFDVSTFLVKYDKPKKTDDKGEQLKEILDVRHMRPALPAEPRVMDFAVGVEVEVLVHGGWSPGKVVAVFGMGKHVVRLMNGGRSNSYHFDSAKMRHNRVWNGSRWVHTNKNPQKLQNVDGINSPATKQKDDAICIARGLSSSSGDNKNPQELQDVDGIKSPTKKQKAAASCVAPGLLSASGDMQVLHVNEDPQKFQPVDEVKSPTKKQKAAAICIPPALLSVSGDMQVVHDNENLQELQNVDGVNSPTKNQNAAASCVAPGSLSASGDMQVLHDNENPQKFQPVDEVKSSTKKQKATAICIPPGLLSTSGDVQVVHDNENPRKLQDVGGLKSPTMKQKGDGSCIAPASFSASRDMQAVPENGNPSKLQDVDVVKPSAIKQKSDASCVAPSFSACYDMPRDGCVIGTSQSVQHLTASGDTYASTTDNQVDHMEAACPTPYEEPLVSMRSCCFNIKHTEAPMSRDAEKYVSGSPCQEGTVVNEDPNVSPLKKVSLPFVKSSFMWETIESMEIFCKMPQEPHFCPLEEYCMDLREGVAIGLMISFDSLVSSTQELRISDAQTEIEARLRTLEELEKNGFNVSRLRMRLNELLQIQLSYKQNETRKAMLEAEMSKMRYDELTASLDTTIGGLEQSLADFREKRDSMMKQKAICESEIVNIQLEAHQVEQTYRSIEENFNSTVVAPL